MIHDGEKIALAVSGGGDSMALAYILRHHDVIALTVDHGLRKESALEAKQTGKRLKEMGVPHKILKWKGRKPKTGVQEAARDARYKLLLDECRAQGIKYLATAHNLEDQVETFWMRLAHGSGLDGLAGMEERVKRDGITLLRPLLSFSRAALRDICKKAGVKWVEDPSNKNKKYLRVRLRAFEKLLSKEGFTPERLARTMHKLNDASKALREIAHVAEKECVSQNDINTTLWEKYPVEIRRRVLISLLKRVSGKTHPPRSESLSGIFDPDFRGKTLMGCKISVRKGKWRVEREKI